MCHRFGTLAILCLVVISSTALGQNSPSSAPITIESNLGSGSAKTILPPVFATGHGTLFSSDGRPLSPSVELLEKTIEFYLDQLASDEKSQELVKTLSDQVTELQSKLDIDDLLTQSILLDLTLKETKLQ